MSDTLELVKALVNSGHVRISEHGYDELAEDGLFARELLSSVTEAELLEDYPEFAKGPCVLLLQLDAAGNRVHAI